jgi:hypothetical protein
MTLRNFAATLSPHMDHEIFPVLQGENLLGTCSLWSLSQVSPEKWGTVKVAEITNHRIHRVSAETDVMEARAC